MFAESVAILRFVGKLGGLYPENPIEALRVDSLIDTAAIDTIRAIESTSLGGGKWATLTEKNLPKEVLEFRKKIVHSKGRGLAHYLKYFENTLKENGSGWLVGNKVTIADLVLYRVVKEGIPRNLIGAAFPSIVAHRRRVEDIPEIVAWHKDYDLPYKDFYFCPESTRRIRVCSVPKDSESTVASSKVH
jgi:glutathione S-transferase